MLPRGSSIGDVQSFDGSGAPDASDIDQQAQRRAVMAVQAQLRQAQNVIFQGQKPWETQGYANQSVTGITPTNFNLPGGHERNDALTAAAQMAQNRVAPGQDFRAGQSALQQYLMGQAQGTGQSVAQQQLRQATDQNIAAQQALAASASPGNSAMAARMAAQNVGRINQGYAGQAALAGTQERMQAANALGGVLSQGRGADLQGQQLNDQAYAQLMAQAQQNAALQQQGNLAYEQNRTQRYGIDAGRPKDPSIWDRIAGGLQGAAGLAGIALTGGAAAPLLAGPTLSGFGTAAGSGAGR